MNDKTVTDKPIVDKPMTAKEYLSQAFWIDQRINAMLEQVLSLRELTTKATGTLSDMPRAASPTMNRMENIIVKIIDLESEINGEIDQLIDLKREMRAVINAVGSPEHRIVLELRHLCFKTWEQIAVEMGYSIQHIYRIHEQALKFIEVPQDEREVIE